MVEEEKKSAPAVNSVEAEKQKPEKPEQVKKEAKEGAKKEIKEEGKKEKKEVKEEKPEEKKEEKAKDEEKKEEKTKEVKIPAKLKKLVEEIENLKVVDLAELVKVLEKKFGVSAVPAVSIQAGGAPAAEASTEEEKKFFNISLTAIGDKKIEVIKVVRDITQRGLKESKDLVDKVAEGPQIIKENVKKEEAEEIKKKLEEAGATVELK